MPTPRAPVEKMRIEAAGQRLLLLLLLLFSHYTDWAGPQPRLWFAKQGK